MDASLIPSVLMVMMVVSHSIVIYIMKKKRSEVDISTEGGAEKAKRFGFIITVLYIEIAVFTALIWLVLAPLMAHTN